MATAIRTATSTITVNAAFLQEIKEVNEELWQLLDNLREVCRTTTAVREHAALLTDMLVEFRDQLALHFALEEAYGYFDEPVMVSASFSQQAVKLRGQHRQLYAEVSRLADDGESLLFDGNLADFITQVPTRFWQFEHELLQHESFENDLIMGQFDDIGVGD